MDPLLIPFLSYAIISIFTPGPSNIAAAALGLNKGYRKSLLFILGMSFSFFLVLLVAGMITEVSTSNYQKFTRILKWIGAAYIVWIAISLFLPEKSEQKGTGKNFGFFGGFLLVLLNPKGIVFAFTTYVAFSSIISGSLLKILMSSMFLMLLLFIASSLWAVMGSIFSSLFKNRKFVIVFNVVMASLLIYSAISIITK